jgi:hypothetical protein
VIISNLLRGYVANAEIQTLSETCNAIMLLKNLLLSDITDGAVILLAESLRNAILRRGLPTCLSFEVSELHNIFR